MPWRLLCLLTVTFGCAGTAGVPHSGLEPPPQQAGLHFDHYALPVRDVERSLSFYTRALGLVEVYNATKKSHIRWLSLGGSRQLHLVQREDALSDQPKGLHLALTTSTFDATLQRLKEHSVPFEDLPGTGPAITTRPDGARQVYLQDPDGYWIELNDASRAWPAPH